MKNVCKRAGALIVSLAVALSMVPLSALAESGEAFSVEEEAESGLSIELVVESTAKEVEGEVVELLLPTVELAEAPTEEPAETEEDTEAENMEAEQAVEAELLPELEAVLTEAAPVALMDDAPNPVMPEKLEITHTETGLIGTVEVYMTVDKDGKRYPAYCLDNVNTSPDGKQDFFEIDNEMDPAIKTMLVNVIHESNAAAWADMDETDRIACTQRMIWALMAKEGSGHEQKNEGLSYEVDLEFLEDVLTYMPEEIDPRCKEYYEALMAAAERTSIVGGPDKVTVIVNGSSYELDATDHYVEGAQSFEREEQWTVAEKIKFAKDSESGKYVSESLKIDLGDMLGDLTESKDGKHCTLPNGYELVMNADGTYCMVSDRKPSESDLKFVVDYLTGDMSIKVYHTNQKYYTGTDIQDMAVITPDPEEAALTFEVPLGVLADLKLEKVDENGNVIKTDANGEASTTKFYLWYTESNGETYYIIKDEDDNFMSVKYDETAKEAVYTIDVTSGELEINKTLIEGMIYYIQEAEAPAGYELDTTIQIICPEDKRAELEAELAANGYQVENVAAGGSYDAVVTDIVLDGEQGTVIRIVNETIPVEDPPKEKPEDPEDPPEEDPEDEDEDTEIHVLGAKHHTEDEDVEIQVLGVKHHTEPEEDLQVLGASHYLPRTGHNWAVILLLSLSSLMTLCGIVLLKRGGKAEV